MSAAKLDVADTQPVAATEVEQSDEGDQAANRGPPKQRFIARREPHECYGRHPSQLRSGKTILFGCRGRSRR
jgi:hypothetical protein